MTEAIGELRRCVDGVWVRLRAVGADDYAVEVTDVASNPIKASEAALPAGADMVRALSQARAKAWELYLSLGGDLESFKR